MPSPFCHGQLRVAPDNRPLSTRNQALKTTLKTKRKKYETQKNNQGKLKKQNPHKKSTINNHYFD